MSVIAALPSRVSLGIIQEWAVVNIPGGNLPSGAVVRMFEPDTQRKTLSNAGAWAASTPSPTPIRTFVRVGVRLWGHVLITEPAVLAATEHCERAGASPVGNRNDMGSGEVLTVVRLMCGMTWAPPSMLGYVLGDCPRSAFPLSPVPLQVGRGLLTVPLTAASSFNKFGAAMLGTHFHRRVDRLARSLEPQALISTCAARSIAIAGCGIGYPFGSAMINPSTPIRFCASRSRATWPTSASSSGPPIEPSATICSQIARSASGICSGALIPKPPS